jgi:hypothetical protein
VIQLAFNAPGMSVALTPVVVDSFHHPAGSHGK